MADTCTVHVHVIVAIAKVQWLMLAKRDCVG